MADLVPAWAHDGERRVPTADEIETGFGCGPFSLPLWNWMFYALWSEIGEVLTFNGITPDNGDMTQLRQAIQAQIDASTGGGDPEQYATIAQLASRLQIYPEVQNANGHFGVITPTTGQVRVPAGVAFLHRGVSPYTTVQTDLATDASKTYHLRWNKTDGFTLKDLASGTYNPGGLLDGDEAFDSTYDDMIVARVITNSSNVPLITNLANKVDFRLTQRFEFPSIGASLDWVELADSGVALNWARTPIAFPSLSHVSSGGSTSSPPADSLKLIGVKPSAAVTRYALPNVGTREFDELGNGGTLHFNWTAIC